MHQLDPASTPRPRMVACVRPCRGQVWSCRGRAPRSCRSARLPYRSIPRAPRQRPSAPTPSPQPARPTCASPARPAYRVADVVAVLQYSSAYLPYLVTIHIVYRDTTQPTACLSQYTLLSCDTVSQPTSLQYTSPILLYKRQSHCISQVMSRYNLFCYNTLNCIAIQFLQQPTFQTCYNTIPHSHNTIRVL